MGGIQLPSPDSYNSATYLRQRTRGKSELISHVGGCSGVCDTQSEEGILLAAFRDIAAVSPSSSSSESDGELDSMSESESSLISAS